MSRSSQRSAVQRAHFEECFRAQAAGRPRYSRASDIVEDVPTLTDVVHEALTLILPWPPTGNHAVVHAATGAHYRTEEYNVYRARVAGIASAARVRTITGRLAVTAMFWPPDKAARDLDNAWKSLGDSLQAAEVYANDSQIDRLELVRMNVRAEGEVCVTIKAAA
jgi:crossover junction endodeoxyribonuclease RusA